MISIQLPQGRFNFDDKAPLGPPGGFGDVYLGTDGSSSQVAVKRLRLSNPSKDAREIDIAKALDGRTAKHIILPLAFGKDVESGDDFLVMPVAEYSLQDFIGSEPGLSEPECAEILQQILNGLLEAHDIVHRDLKPGNVLFHGGSWKIADFGIARFYEESTSSETLKRCLSPLYASPEQFEFERATHASDIYSLGCIGYYLLTGYPPYRSQYDVMEAGITPPPLNLKDRRLSALLYQMLNRQPAGRPSINRIKTLLSAVINDPISDSSHPILSDLARVDNNVVRKALEIQTEEAHAARLKEERMQLQQGAVLQLKDIFERMWGEIKRGSTTASRSKPDHSGVLKFVLGAGVLTLRVESHYLDPDSFRRSGWDVVACGEVIVEQAGQNPQKLSSSLWYVKLPNSEDYRWVQVAYFAFASSSPFTIQSLNDIRLADGASSTGTGTWTVGYGPKPIDVEDESRFQEMWIGLLARAAEQNLPAVRSLPMRTWFDGKS